MKKNMGTLDKSIRLIAAVLFVLLAAIKVVTGIFAIVLLVFAVVFAVTSFISFCPLYLPFGINTGKKKE